MTPTLMCQLLRDLNRLHLRLIRRALDSLEQSIRDSIKWAEEAAQGDPEFAEAVGCDEYELIEAILGCAFVICQTHIVRVVTSARRMDAPDKEPSKVSLMQSESDPVGHSGITQIEAIDAVANYFKHRAEWRVDWNELEEPSRRTAGALQKIGLSSGSTGNLHEACRLLGDPTYTNLQMFADILEEWDDRVMTSYQNRLHHSLG